MTIEEYGAAEPKINNFKILKDKISNYESQRNRISNGILSITAYYQHEINFIENKSLEQKVVNAIVRVYEDEISSIEKEMNDIKL